MITKSGTRRPEGRPPLSPDLARTERVVTFLTPTERKKLAAFAAAKNQSISAASRALITQTLKRDAAEARQHTNRTQS